MNEPHAIGAGAAAPAPAPDPWLRRRVLLALATICLLWLGGLVWFADTMPTEIAKLSREMLHDPVMFNVESPTNSPPDSAASSLTVKVTGLLTVEPLR